MKLIYHEGNNFGDKLNPLLFNKLLPGVLDNNEDELFLGIGSILGLKQKYKQKKIVFSSGYAADDIDTYGQVPIIDNSYEILCVRGPLTCDILNLDQKYAVADGALLINEIIPDSLIKKEDNVIYIPHHKSEDMYEGWEELCLDAGMKYVSPKWEVQDVLREIKNAKLVITESMHGAIVADSMRVPWIPVKAFPYINEFKWHDWGKSLEMDFRFHSLPSIHSSNFFNKILQQKISMKLPEFISNPVSGAIHYKRRKEFVSGLKKLKNRHAHLSDEEVWNNKVSQLYDILETFKVKKGFI
ncbi:polysaccharide pyruvyl transferase family protein [Sulfurovum sp.]|uniref:polysaccharide pyruvyl transferase family protein n=1 Tax=Sulfurovum sp. TaxID=1969726 RepID=UPI003561A131